MMFDPENKTYPRDMIGYGQSPPHVQWPNGARIAVQLVLNYEEGGENNILHGDAASEAFLSEIVGAQAWPGLRHMNMESIYEYGSRAGFWRLHRLFTERNLPVTVFGVATAMARHPEAVRAMQQAGWEIATHGLKWIDYRDFSAADEAHHIAEAVRIQTELTGARPLGMYQGRTSANTTMLTMREQGFLYSSDSYADELPYWIKGPHGPHLIVPYTLDANDMRFATPQGFNSGEQFFTYLRDSFDVLYGEGATSPKMMSVGLHCRLVGRPGRIAALARFLDHVQSHDKVWVTTRLDIAKHWIKFHPPTDGYSVAGLPRALFVERFGDIFEHTPEVAELAHRKGLPADAETAAGLHRTMVAIMRELSEAKQLALIKAHPDLAGRLALAGRVTADSRLEQQSAGLDRLSPEELAAFTMLNATYQERFGFPFIMSVKGRDKTEILTALRTRVTHEHSIEFRAALQEIERIALLRIQERLA
jgi:OHCU decarboxylase